MWGVEGDVRDRGDREGHGERRGKLQGYSGSCTCLTRWGWGKLLWAEGALHRRGSLAQGRGE